MWEGIRYFQPDEFSSPDAPGSGSKMNLDFVKLLDELRSKCGFPLFISSGYRTPEHNREVGGVDSSSHENGLAVDITARDSHTRFVIVENAIALGFRRVGIGFSFIHLDMDLSKPDGVTWLYPPAVSRTRTV